MRMNESSLDKKSNWYFGNNRAKNLRLSPPKWDAPFFLTTSYEYAEDYSDYGVYKIELANQRDFNILDFNNEKEVQKLGWPEVLVDKILEGRNDLNSLAYDLYLLANGRADDLMYIENTDEWLDAAIWFQDRSEDIFKLVKSKGIWGSEKDHQFLLQMWKDIYDAGFDGFTHQEFGHKILALFDLKYIDKISVKPASKQVNEASRLSLSDVLLQLKQQVNDAGARCDSIEVLNDKFHHNTVVLYGDFHDKIALDTLRFNYANGNIASIDKGWYEGTRCMNKWRGIVKPIIDSLLPNGIEEGSSVQLHEKKKHRFLKKQFNAKGQDAFPKIKLDDDIVFVSGIPKDKALQLLKKACHDVSNFHPEYMEKAIKWSDDQIFGAFNKNDKRNVLAIASVSLNGDESGAAYLHEMTGFIKGGYGKKLVMWLLQKFKKVYGQITLEGSGTKDDPYRPNEKLRDKFYATIPGMKIYRVENSIWNCPADFFYYGISNESIKEFLETTYGSKQSTLNEDRHQFYCIDKNDEVVAKCRNPIGKIGISIYDDINAVGIGSFEIFKPYRRMGHAKNILQKLVKKLKSKYSLVYCFVDKDNYPALSLYRQLGKVSNHLNANGQYEVRFWESTEDDQSASSKNIKNLFDEVVSKYKDVFGFDLSYMTFKVDRQPVYTNGEPCYEYDEDECAGGWTSLGWIRLNPDMKSVIDRYGVDWHGSDDIEEFTKIIIAHELAHEVWNHIADDQFKEDVLDEARMQSFNTVYLDTVKPSSLDEETFCEYLAHQVVQQKKDISFPDEEIVDLSKQNHIVTHRVSDDANRFNVGDVVLPSWGISYKVSSKLMVDKVEDSPYINDLTPQQLAFLDDFDEIAVLELDAQYDPPYTLEQIKAKYPENIYNKLDNDPVHKWRAETGIELIHKEPTDEELDRIWKNWQLMPQDMKDISDKKSIEMFGCTNAEHYNKLKTSENHLNENKAAYLQKYRDESDVKSIVDMFWSIRDRLSTPQNDIDWWIKKPFNDLKNFVQKILTHQIRNSAEMPTTSSKLLTMVQSC